MKKQQINQGLLITLLLASLAVQAEEYPAANFQPKVIYSSEPAASNTQTASSSSPCESKTTQQSQKVEQTAFDAKYPAASFQPKVIYSN